MLPQASRPGKGVIVVTAYTKKDHVYRAAQRAGFRSRAAVKLEEIDKRFDLLRKGQRVVDLGCAPGGWLQVAAARVGPQGRVVGVDVEPTEDLAEENVRIVVGDLRDAEVRRRIRDEIGGPADVVLSDMAPKLSGIKVADRERHLALAGLAGDVAAELLSADGRAVIKLFSAAEGEASRLLKQRFRSVVTFRPPSTRKGSSEIYAVVGGLRGG